MGSVGDCFDNAMYESFFATLECELLDRRPFESQAEASMAIFEFIEGWYNPHRRHSSIGYLSPVNYERRICPTRTRPLHPRLDSQAVNRPWNGGNSRTKLALSLQCCLCYFMTDDPFGHCNQFALSSTTRNLVRMKSLCETCRRSAILRT